MAGAMDGDQGEVAFVFLVITSSLFTKFSFIHHIWNPFLFCLPVEMVDPSFGADGWDGGVFVAGEVHHADWRILK